MRENLFSIITALGCMATGALAQILVPPDGTTLTFDTRPTPADGWSTLSVAGEGPTIENPAALDAAVQTHTASAVTNALGSSSTWPPSETALARWNSGHYLLQTRPAGNAYLLLLAKLVNDTGSQTTTLTLQYEYGIYWYWDPDVPGHRVFWSTTGNTNDWHLINSLSGSTTAGTLSANVDLSTSPWAAGSTLYVLWADDNGESGTDGSYTIDNFTISTESAGPRLTIKNNGDGTMIVSWNPTGGTLQESTDLRNWSNASDQRPDISRPMSGNLFYRIR